MKSKDKKSKDSKSTSCKHTFNLPFEVPDLKRNVAIDTL